MAAVAQLVEQWFVVPCVAGSIPVSRPRLESLEVIQSIMTDIPLVISLVLPDFWKQSYIYGQSKKWKDAWKEASHNTS